MEFVGNSTKRGLNFSPFVICNLGKVLLWTVEVFMDKWSGVFASLSASGRTVINAVLWMPEQLSVEVLFFVVILTN